MWWPSPRIGPLREVDAGPRLRRRQSKETAKLVRPSDTEEVARVTEKDRHHKTGEKSLRRLAEPHRRTASDRHATRETLLSRPISNSIGLPREIDLSRAGLDSAGDRDI